MEIHAAVAELNAGYDRIILIANSIGAYFSMNADIDVSGSDPKVPIGVYTIMEVRSGKGSSAGWGRLKSGIGWISLDFVKRI